MTPSTHSRFSGAQGVFAMNLDEAIHHYKGRRQRRLYGRLGRNFVLNARERAGFVNGTCMGTSTPILCHVAMDSVLCLRLGGIRRY